jgi:putative PIN family toxin of toxin-antitoxin system
MYTNILLSLELPHTVFFSDDDVSVLTSLDAYCDIIYDTIMSPQRVVIDTNILYAGLYSSTGASYQILRLVRSGQIIPCISVTLAMEYEAVLTAKLQELNLTKEELDGFLGYFVSLAEWVKIYYLWRPGLHDPGDDMVLEAAVTAPVNFIITHNIKDFKGAELFGIQVVKPCWYINSIGGTP